MQILIGGANSVTHSSSGLPASPISCVINRPKLLCLISHCSTPIPCPQHQDENSTSLSVDRQSNASRSAREIQQYNSIRPWHCGAPTTTPHHLHLSADNEGSPTQCLQLAVLRSELSKKSNSLSPSWTACPTSQLNRPSETALLVARIWWFGVSRRVRKGMVSLVLAPRGVFNPQVPRYQTLDPFLDRYHTTAKHASVMSIHHRSPHRESV